MFTTIQMQRKLALFLFGIFAVSAWATTTVVTAQDEPMRGTLNLTLQCLKTDDAGNAEEYYGTLVLDVYYGGKLLNTLTWTRTAREAIRVTQGTQVSDPQQGRFTFDIPKLIPGSQLVVKCRTMNLLEADDASKDDQLYSLYRRVFKLSDQQINANSLLNNQPINNFF